METDPKILLRKKSRIKRELLAQNRGWIDKRIAILGGSTTNELKDQLELQLLNHGIRAEFYQSEFNRFFEDAVFDNEILEKFQPEIVYIHTSWRNISQFENLQTEFDRFAQVWESLRKKYHCSIIQNNFDRPNFRLLGNRDVSHGLTNFIFKLNSKLNDYAQTHEDFFINDLDYLAAEFGLSRWSDPKFWFLYKYAMNLESIPLVAKSVGDIVKSLLGRNKKLIALDLDGTLWKGIIGDDGIDGIEIGNETSAGQIFVDLQKYLRELKNLGILLAVNSKNDLENALAGLNHPDGILRPDDFVSIKANWNSKDQNLREIAAELSLGLESFVFIDDSEFEREIVRKNLPQVEVIDFDSPEEIVQILDRSGFFEITKISDEDRKRSEQYRARAEAIKLESKFSNYDEFLESLKMEVDIREFDKISLGRIAQLVNKTNQFNLTTRRFTESEIRSMSQDPRFICLQGKLKDRFGDYGIVSIILGEIFGDEVEIDLFLMSCRVLKRRFENSMLARFEEECRARGIRSIVGKFFPTQKNSMVRDLYSQFGFEKILEDEKGNSKWKKFL